LIQEVTLREILRIFEITDAMGIHREALVIPLGPRHPGRVRKMPNGKIEIIVDAQADLEEWLKGLKAELERVLSGT
jgi:hypothetical protein